MAQPHPKRIPVKKPDYDVIGDLRAELANIVAKYKAIYPAMDLIFAVKAKILTEHGDEEISVKVKEIPPYQQLPLGLEEIDMDLSYRARLEQWKQMQKEEEDKKRKEKEDQGDDDEQ